MHTNLFEPIESTTIIQNLAELLKAHYIYPDVAEEISQRLHRYFKDGEYDNITEGDMLAQTLTEHLQEIRQDEHLWVRWHPDPLPDYQGSMLQNPDWIEEIKQQAKSNNYGIHKVERLAGNIGYLDIRYFYRPSWGSGDTITAAMTFLANSSALIIDVRKCTGGNPNSVALVSSYLFNEEPVHLNSLYWRDEEITEQYWTSAYLPGRRIADIPVYVLISQMTFSAGEEFAYNLQSLQRATLVGESTSGGAHPGSPYRLHAHLEVFIPRGRAINPITNTNWEGSGVAPDISVEEDQALIVAYRAALKDIIAALSDKKSKADQKLIDEIQATLKDL